jgi:ribose transport system substrate-binding protein
MKSYRTMGLHVSVGALAIVCLLLPACRPQDERQEKQQKVRLAFITNNASDFWLIANAGIRKANQDFNADCVMKLPGSATPGEQKNIIEDLLAQGIQGLAISPIDPASQTDLLNRAAGSIKLVTQDSDAPASNRLCYIGTNNYKAGLQAGDALKQALPDGGKVWAFVGKRDQQNAADRFRGLTDAIKGTKIEVVDLRTDDADPSRAKANAEDVIAANKDVAGLVGLWAYNGPAILEAVRGAGKAGTIRIVCFDEMEATLQGVLDGHIHATIVQQPYKFGYESVRVLSLLVRGDNSVIPEGKVLDVPTKSITRENVRAFWDELKRLLGKV